MTTPQLSVDDRVLLFLGASGTLEFEFRGTAVGPNRIGVRVPALDPATVIAPVVSDRWSARFPAPQDVQCGSRVELDVELVYSELVNDQAADRVREFKSHSFNVWCASESPDTCPLLHDSKVPTAFTVAGSTCEQGRRLMRLTVHFAAPLSRATTGRFVEEGMDLTADVGQGGDWQHPDGVFEAEVRMPPGYHIVVFRLSSRPECEYPLAFTVNACECALGLIIRPHNDPMIVARVGADHSVSGSVEGSPRPEVFQLGKYDVTAVIGDAPLQNWPHSWRVDGYEQNEDGSTLAGVELSSLDSIVRCDVKVRPPGCDNDLDNHIELNAPPGSCPGNDLKEEIEVRRDGSVVLSFKKGADLRDLPCLAPGTYDVVVRVPEPGPGWTYSWSHGLSTVREANPDPTLHDYQVSDDTATQSLDYRIQRPGCPPINGTIPMLVCRCPDDFGIRILDPGGTEIDEKTCLEPGEYTAEITGVPREVDADFEWTVNGRDAGAGSRVTFSVMPVLLCTEPEIAYKIEATVTPRRGSTCASFTRSRTFQLCGNWRTSLCCWLLEAGIVLGILFCVFAGLLALCPAEITRPKWLDWIAGQSSIPQVLAFLVACATAWQVVAAVCLVVYIILACIVALVIVPLMIGLYVNKCKPNWCFGWIPLIWQIALGTSFLALCCVQCLPCSIAHVVVCVIALIIALFVMGYWLLTCGPGPCRTMFELAKVASALAAIPMFVISAFAAPCTFPLAPLIHDWLPAAALILLAAAGLCSSWTLARNFRRL